MYGCIPALLAPFGPSLRTGTYPARVKSRPAQPSLMIPIPLEALPIGPVSNAVLLVSLFVTAAWLYYLYR